MKKNAESRWNCWITWEKISFSLDKQFEVERGRHPEEINQNNLFRAMPPKQKAVELQYFGLLRDHEEESKIKEKKRKIIS